jgi:LysM repeat protein
MKVTALAVVAAMTALSLFGSPAAHAQTTKNQKQVKTVAKQEVSVVVAEGNTLSQIATDHQTTYQRLYDANTQVEDPDLIYPGENIRIPDVSEQIAHRDIPAEDVAAADAQAQTLHTATQPASQAQATSTPAAAPAYVPAPAPTTVAGCGDNSYANYIYMHESGCNTSSTSPNGCFGIGQACPASKLAYCGTDYSCQNAFFTSYANKYGGWAGAYNFWVSHGWW